ncbi:hypothetical protein OAB00_04570 [Akkermansiaceae bacterium]|nr:hypothetical protein [Akkermansiaceae bacterium]
MKNLILIATFFVSTSVTFSQESVGSFKKPIRCDSPNGEGAYLSRLRYEDESDLSWERLGSFGGENGLLDGYKNNKGKILYFDMHHPRYIEIKAPDGYRLLWEWSDKYEYVKGLICQVNNSEPYTGKVDLKVDDTRVVVKIEKGVIKGKLKQFYTSGKIKRISVYVENRLEGKEMWYRQDGKLWAFYHYKEGVLNGLFQLYDENGKIEIQRNYIAGELVQDK